MVETYLQQCGDSGVDIGDDEESPFQRCFAPRWRSPDLSEIDCWRKKILSGTAKICLSVLLWTGLVFVLQYQSREPGTQVSTKFSTFTSFNVRVGKSEIQTDILCTIVMLRLRFVSFCPLWSVSSRRIDTENDCGF